MHIEMPVTRDPNYKPKSLVEHAYEHGKKDGVKAMLDYIRKMALTQDNISYDCYVEAKDWAEKTFGINEDPNLQKMPACNIDLHKALEEGTGLYGTALKAMLASNDDTAEPTIDITPSELWDIALKHRDEERKKRWKH